VQVHYEKVPEKDPQVLLQSSDLGCYRVAYEEQVKGMFLKRRQFGAETGQETR
jgi:hypothetical protein